MMHSVRKARLAVLFVAAAMALASLAQQGCGKPVEEEIEWEGPSAGSHPFTFNHKSHIEAEDMDCTDCHRFAAKGVHATLPRIKDCRDCHSEPQGEHPDEPKVREYLDAGAEIPWSRVNRLPGHVYFSHRAHVGFAEMDCMDCHSDMRVSETPLKRPDIHHLTMSNCMSCHQEKKAANECSTCHK
jgi:menaquinone reductase, multiheme cytochrome c subunit